MSDIRKHQKKRLKRNLIGQRFGSLAVLYRDPNRGTTERSRVFWVCKCDCGKLRAVLSQSLIRGATKSCGCIRNALFAQTVQTHGRSATKEYKIWTAMKSRCYNQNDHHYKNYGGRGIGVCDRWRYSFVNFFQDVGEIREGYSIDRINNDGNYEPGNVRWATPSEQMSNTRTNRYVTLYGERMNTSQAARKVGMTLAMFVYRSKHGRVPGVALLLKDAS